MAEHETTSRGSGPPAGTADDSHLSSRPRAGSQEPGDHAIGHGNSPAAWVAAGIILVGSLVSSLAVVFAQVWLFWVGIVVIVGGLVAGKVLSAMGFGQQSAPTPGEAAGGDRR